MLNCILLFQPLCKSRVINDDIADNDFGVFTVTETYLRGDDYEHYYIRGSCPYGYNIFHIPRFHSTRGGVGVVLKALTALKLMMAL